LTKRPIFTRQDKFFARALQEMFGVYRISRLDDGDIICYSDRGILVPTSAVFQSIEEGQSVLVREMIGGIESTEKEGQYEI